MSVDLILEVKILHSLLNNYILKIKSDGLEPKNNDYKTYARSEKEFVRMVFTQAEVIKKILDIPIITEKGELSEESSLENVHALTDKIGISDGK